MRFLKIETLKKNWNFLGFTCLKCTLDIPTRQWILTLLVALKRDQVLVFYLKWLSQAVTLPEFGYPPLTTTSLISSSTRIFPYSSQTAPELALWFPITQSELLLRPLRLLSPASQFLPVQILPLLQGPAKKEKKKGSWKELFSCLNSHCTFDVCHSQLFGLYYR